MNRTSARVIFFDIGDTLVRRVAASPSGEQFTWIPGAKDTLKAVRDAGLRLGLLSNTGPLTRNQLLARLPNDFDFGFFDQTLVVLSSEVGLEKPDPRIFRLAVNLAQQLPFEGVNLQIDAWHCLFCGESLAECLIAQQVGMTAVRLNFQPAPEISTLHDELKAAGLMD